MDFLLNRQTKYLNQQIGSPNKLLSFIVKKSNLLKQEHYLICFIIMNLNSLNSYHKFKLFSLLFRGDEIIISYFMFHLQGNTINLMLSKALNKFFLRVLLLFWLMIKMSKSCIYIIKGVYLNQWRLFKNLQHKKLFLSEPSF